jgi:hypothetical protein
MNSENTVSLITNRITTIARVSIICKHLICMTEVHIKSTDIYVECVKLNWGRYEGEPQWLSPGTVSSLSVRDEDNKNKSIRSSG